jgi:RNA polymerase sigma-70 factor, ECF subfamily
MLAVRKVIPFCVPEPPEWNERLTFVLDAIYSAYTTGWESLMEVSSTHHALAGDAIAIGLLRAHAAL